MPGYDAITSVDLSGAIGRFVRFVAGSHLIELNTTPGTVSLGVLESVTTIGAVQYGRVVESANLQQIQCDLNVIPASSPITNDAAGAAKVAVGPDVVSALARFASIGTPRTVLAQVMTSNDPGGASFSQPLNQVLFGTGPSVSSDPHFKWDAATATLQVTDLAGKLLFASVGTVASRGVSVLDNVGFVISSTSNTPGSREWGTRDSLGDAAILFVNTDVLVRTVEILDDNKDPIWTVFSRSATRVIKTRDPLGNDLQNVDTVNRSEFWLDELNAAVFEQVNTAAIRTAKWSNPTGASVLALDTKAASQSVTMQDAVGAPVFAINGPVGGQSIIASIPTTLGSYTVAALPTPPNGGDGSIAFASNGRVGAEGPGAGTGTSVQYKSAGPAGAGWYDTPVTLVTA